MKKIKTSELKGVALDWAVTKCEGFLCDYQYNSSLISYSTNWSQGGPIIERENLQLGTWQMHWFAYKANGPRVGQRWNGPTPLIAAMRCYVASKLGEEVEIPDGLLEEDNE